MAAGGALLLFFWAQKLTLGLRSLLATALVATVFFLVLIDETSSSDMIVTLIGLAAVCGVVVFPVVYLCSRKLERQAGISVTTFE
jgi:hypothetical protein